MIKTGVLLFGPPGIYLSLFVKSTGEEGGKGRSRLFFITYSVVFLKPTVSIRPSDPSSGSHKFLRFVLMADTVHFKGFYLFIYLLTYKKEEGPPKSEVC